MENENILNFKIRGMFDTNVTYPLTKGKKVTKKAAKEYLLRETSEVIFTLDEYNGQNDLKLDGIHGHRFALYFNSNTHNGDLLSFIGFNNYWVELDVRERIITQYLFQKEEVKFKNIKIISVEDIYEETLDIDDQYPYETHIKFEVTIPFTCKELKGEDIIDYGI